MKKAISLITVLMMVVLMCCACGGAGEETIGSDEIVGEESEKPKVAFLCNGTLGDESFFDDAATGIQKLEEEGYETKIIEAGYDKTNWLPALEDVSDGDYDIIIVGTWEMVEPLESVAEEYPDKKFILFDSEMNYEDDAYPNVFSIVYNYNEGSYLAGVLAAEVSNSSLENANDDKVISFIGGIDSPVINDFLVGYIQGAKYVDPEMKVVVSYIGDFADSATGKEMGLVHCNNNNADVLYAAAGQAGLGVLDAAKEGSVYAIGMASDQSAIFAESDPEKANLILSSMLSDCGISLYDAVVRADEGSLPWGTVEYQGIKEGSVKLVDNDVYQALPDEIKASLDSAEEAFINGEVELKSALTMSSDEIKEMIGSVAP